MIRDCSLRQRDPPRQYARPPAGGRSSMRRAWCTNFIVSCSASHLCKVSSLEKKSSFSAAGKVIHNQLSFQPIAQRLDAAWGKGCGTLHAMGIITATQPGHPMEPGAAKSRMERLVDPCICVLVEEERLCSSYT